MHGEYLAAWWPLLEAHSLGPCDSPVLRQAHSSNQQRFCALLGSPVPWLPARALSQGDALCDQLRSSGSPRCSLAGDNQRFTRSSLSSSSHPRWVAGAEQGVHRPPPKATSM